MARLRPPALDLPDETAVRWTSFTKIIRWPEANWPAQIYERPIIAGRVGTRSIALIADPEAAKTVLGGSEERFPKWRIYDRVVGSGTGRDNLSVASGEQWRHQRQAFGPMFAPERARELVPLFQSAAASAVAEWSARGGEVCLDASLEMTRLTLCIIWRVLFAAGARSNPPPSVARAAESIHAAQLSGDPNTPAIKLAELAEEAGQLAPKLGAVPGNPFDAWGTASADTEDGLTRQQLYDNARLFLGAGHETTALTLTWGLWLVAQDAEMQRRIHDEIDQVVGDGTIEDSHTLHLVFTGQVLNETLRLFPPAFVTVRQSRDPIVLADQCLPAATVLAVCIYALHRHRSWWQDPDLFDPDRFDAGEPRHRYAYLPFSAGRHACIGAAFAWKEAITIFATILQQFSVSTDPAVPVRPRLSITLRPDRTVPIVLHRRR
jgi:cytochrome P450